MIFSDTIPKTSPDLQVSENLTKVYKYFTRHHNSRHPLVLTFVETCSIVFLKSINVTMKKVLFVLISLLAINLSAGAQIFSKGKTINVIPDNASIMIGGVEVATGSYVLQMGRQDYVMLRLTAPGYIDKTVRVYKADKSNTLTFKLEIDDSWAASETSSDLANKSMSVIVREGMNADDVWKRIIYYTSDLFPNMEISDKSAGWIRSSWELQTFAYSTIRTRIEIKEVPGQDDLRYKVTLRSEYAWNDCGLDDQCFKAWDRVLKKYKQAIEDLVSALR